jgi:preprotein translocase subunit SecE
MKANAEEKDSRLDWLMWAIVAAILLALAVLSGGPGFVGNFEPVREFAGRSALIRWPALLVLAAIAVAAALKTSQGGAFWVLAKAARSEIRKVVWPTRQETTQTTLIVVVVVVVMALILWGLDTFLGWIASMLIA